MANRLADATSPYLAQHADNPVDWWPWCDEAFAEARRRQVPVLLSVGYAACHWCHVMAHESFEDDEVAAVLNNGYVSIKVDREERPDNDAIYMTATTAMTGHGGWPMTCVLTPSGEPFYTGTYYPKAQFLSLLDAVSTAWNEQRDEVLAAGGRIAEAIASMNTAMSPDAITAEVLDEAQSRLARSFDRANGGFGSAPKFPPSMVLEFLLRQHARTGSAAALEMAEQTCEAMARGGMYDQLAGGFARYSVDEAWVVPHFEKMLYDNAQLLRVYVHLWRATGSPLARRVATETAEFLIRDLGTAEGGFASALDADTDGVEGLTYAWTPGQLVELLGAEAGRAAAELLSVTDRGTFEHGSSTLQLRADPVDASQWAEMRSKLLAARNERPQPARDDKVVTAWNGLAIAGLAEAGALLNEPRYVGAASAAADLLLRTHLVDGRLRRSSLGGIVGDASGVAEDYGDFAEGLLALFQVVGDARYLRAAADLLEVALAHFSHEDGGFHDTADDAEQLLMRPRDPADNAVPGGQSAIAGALLTCSALTGSPRHREAADRALASVGQLARREPRFTGWALAVAQAAVAGPLQVAIVGDGPGADALVAATRRSSSPGLVTAFGQPDKDGVELLAGRPVVAGRPAAYVCRGFVCDRPVTEVSELEQLLTSG